MERLFVDYIAGELDERAIGHGEDNGLREAVEANVDSFVEMFVANLDAEGEEAAHEDEGVVDQLVCPSVDGCGIAGEEVDVAAKRLDEELQATSIGPNASSSSSDPPALANPVASSSAAASSNAVAEPALEGVPAYMVGVVAQDLDAGGWVKRGDRYIGRITRWGRNYGLRCAVHRGCSIAVTQRCALADCVEWIAKGVETPPVCTDEVRARAKRDHYLAARPRPLQPPIVT